MALTRALMIDTQSGTIFDAYNARIVIVDTLDPEQREILEHGSDSEIQEIAQEHGHPVLDDFHAMEAIAKVLRRVRDGEINRTSLTNIVTMTGRSV